jgi:hypothetical protein
MIVWINGPFGVGKSTVASLIAEQRPDATLFDPELLGFALRNWYPTAVTVGDFQSLSVWRRLVVEAAIGLIRDFGRPLIVPMTLLNPAYFDEIVGDIRGAGITVHHFCLTATRDEVLRRVAERGHRGAWFTDKYDEYVAAFDDPRFDRRIDSTDRPARSIADEILAAIGAAGV